MAKRKGSIIQPEYYWQEENPSVWRLYTQQDNPLVEVTAVSAEGRADFEQLISRIAKGFYRVDPMHG